MEMIKTTEETVTFLTHAVKNAPLIELIPAPEGLYIKSVGGDYLIRDALVLRGRVSDQLEKLALSATFQSDQILSLIKVSKEFCFKAEQTEDGKVDLILEIKSKDDSISYHRIDQQVNPNGSTDLSEAKTLAKMQLKTSDLVNALESVDSTRAKDKNTLHGSQSVAFSLRRDRIQFFSLDGTRATLHGVMPVGSEPVLDDRFTEDQVEIMNPKAVDALREVIQKYGDFWCTLEIFQKNGSPTLQIIVEGFRWFQFQAGIRIQPFRIDVIEEFITRGIKPAQCWYEARVLGWAGFQTLAKTVEGKRLSEDDHERLVDTVRALVQAQHEYERSEDEDEIKTLEERMHDIEECIRCL